MAIIKDLISGDVHPLKMNHTIGRRSDVVDLPVLEREISALHASISWNGKYWEIVDTSRNGTFINGARIEAGIRRKLDLKHIISFSNSSSHRFEVIDDSAPQALLIDKSSCEPLVIEGIKSLPSEESPTVSVFKDKGQWVEESRQGARILKKEDEVSVGDQTWRFFDPENHDLTEAFRPHETAPRFELLIRVSSDFENVRVSVKQTGKQTIDLGLKSHHFILYLLAKAYKEDLEQGKEQERAGWIETHALASMMKMEVTHINIQVYRFRKALTKILDISPTDIFHRKDGEIRIGIKHFQLINEE